MKTILFIILVASLISIACTSTEIEHKNNVSFDIIFTLIVSVVTAFACIIGFMFIL